MRRTIVPAVAIITIIIIAITIVVVVVIILIIIVIVIIVILVTIMSSLKQHHTLQDTCNNFMPEATAKDAIQRPAPRL